MCIIETCTKNHAHIGIGNGKLLLVSKDVISDDLLLSYYYVIPSVKCHFLFGIIGIYRFNKGCSTGFKGKKDFGSWALSFDKDSVVSINEIGVSIQRDRSNPKAYGKFFGDLGHIRLALDS